MTIQDICVLCIARELSKPLVFETAWLPGPINLALYDSRSQQVNVA